MTVLSKMQRLRKPRCGAILYVFGSLLIGCMNRDYRNHLEGQDFTAGTKAQYLRAVKHFFKWTAAEGLYPDIAQGIKGAKVKQDNTKKEAFSADDMKAILDSIDRTTETGKRDYAMILLSVTGS